MPYNGATATWSGYNHQGKVGLFVALQEMARLLHEAGSPDSDSVPAVFANWCLEFEGAEDFDICETPLGDGVGNVYSRHQVKAYNGDDAKSFKKYNDVLNPHTVVVTLKDGSKKTKQVEGFKKQVTDIHDNDLGQTVAADRRFLHVIQAISDWGTPGNQNKNEVGLYPYPDEAGGWKPYCSLSETYENDNAITQCPLFKIASAAIQAIDPSNYSDSRAVLIWQCLQAQLQNMVASAHVAKTRACLTFIQIYQIIIAGGGAEDWNRDRVKRKIQYEWEIIQQAREANNEEFDANYGRAKDWIEGLLLKNDGDFTEAIGRLRPHRQDTRDLDIDEHGFRYVVHEVIKRVEQYPPSHEGPHYNHDGQRYYLTTISDEDVGNENKVVAQKVLDGINAKTDGYFQQGKIITKSLSIDFEQFVRDDEFSGFSKLAGFEASKYMELAPKSLINTTVAIDELNRRD